MSPRCNWITDSLSGCVVPDRNVKRNCDCAHGLVPDAGQEINKYIYIWVVFITEASQDSECFIIISIFKVFIITKRFKHTHTKEGGKVVKECFKLPTKTKLDMGLEELFDYTYSSLL